jgi:hypothetical protein
MVTSHNGGYGSRSFKQNIHGSENKRARDCMSKRHAGSLDKAGNDLPRFSMRFLRSKTASPHAHGGTNHSASLEVW